MNQFFYSILVFPQYFRDGNLYFNIVVLPRNIDLFKSFDNLPPFVEAELSFEIKAIDSLDGLPLTASPMQIIPPEIPLVERNKVALYQQILEQMERNDNLKVSDNPEESQDYGAEAQKQKFNNPVIRKYLPISYRESFNFTSPRTRFAITDDEYECIIKNKEKEISDTVSNRDYISWGKLIAFILRNPALAEKAGLIYKGYIPVRNELFKKGGYLFADFASGSVFGNVSSKVYASRIPSLKEERQIFAPVLFPVGENASNNVTYDAVVQEAILYNDGFGKIVHVNQPVNQDLLQEKDTSNPPLKDVGFRLGWDDEQLTIWGNRQIRQKDELTELDIDAPLGIFGYKIDVRKKDTEKWFSQNSIRPVQTITDPNGNPILEAATSFELPFEVHPSSHGDTMTNGFWLPMYYASWNGKCMVIPDKEAQEIHQLSEDAMLPVEGLDSENGLNVVPKRMFHPFVQDESQQLPLRYGEGYEFRIRYMDISGGGPSVEDTALNGGQNPVAYGNFRRHVAAAALEIGNVERFFQPQDGIVKDISVLENILNEDNTLYIKRPFLSYPSVAFTGKYSNAAALLIDKINTVPTPSDPKKRKEYVVGLPDPDVKNFHVLVEIKTLEMDNGSSLNGKENYLKLYEKKFSIPYSEQDENYDFDAQIKIIYKDYDRILYLNGFNDLGNVDELVLPTSRNLRLTFTPLIEEADNYAASFIHEGKKTVLTSFKAASKEKGILPKDDLWIKAYYLQPEKELDPAIVVQDNEIHITTKENNTSVELLRLAEALNLSAKNVTLQGEPGQRVQFGVSHQIRHSLAPDASSVTLASNQELFNQWIVAVNFPLQRDWGWDALAIESFSIFRSIHLHEDTGFVEQEKLVGTIDVKDTANFSMLVDPDRLQSRIIFLDVIDPKQKMDEFPRELIAQYRIKIHLKDEFENTEKDEDVRTRIHLPITIIPKQIPKMVSTGIAMTPYSYDKDGYRSSDERQKYIWFEFDSPPLDQNDTYFGRVISYAPDPYLCRVDEELLTNKQNDLPFNINAEKIREIIPNMENDFGGIGVMQELIPQIDGDGKKTYLLPLPTGLHPNSDELFGFFIYEIRLGHKKEFWSTAQARYGRPLRINGVQHPAPELVCNVYRSDHGGEQKYIEISANHANAVFNGKNITAFPPNTSLWYLLYTQVMQADGLSFRNILIDSGPMRYEVKKSRSTEKPYVKESGNRLGIARVSMAEIGNRLDIMGLPKSNTLSVIAVEMFPLSNTWQSSLAHKSRREFDVDSRFIEEYNRQQFSNPLIELLGDYRMYRSSILTPVNEVCCEDC